MQYVMAWDIIQTPEDAARAGAALLWSQAERAGLGQPGEEKAPEGS